MNSELALSAAATICVFFLTLLIRRLALYRGVLDIPNDRSSHCLPTPRGGGLAIIMVYCSFVVTFSQLFDAEIGIVIACLATGLVGLVDDINSQPAKYRLGVHAVSAGIIVYAVDGVPPIDFGFGPIDMGWIGYVVAILGTVWMINLTNFMDGIDGLVASQLTLASMVATGLLLLTQMPEGLVFPTLLLAASTFGFLLLNWAPAKIFMGDVGSGALGLIMSGLMLWHTQANAQWLFVWLILNGMLTVDASYTLLVRALRGRRLSEGHRSHAYQHLSQRLRSHKKVTLLEGGILMFWLMPLASGVALNWFPGFWAMVFAYMPLTAACVWLRAGKD